MMWGGTVSKSVCAKCGHTIDHQEPVYLQTSPHGELVGPFHSVCAYQVNLARYHGALSAVVIAQNELPGMPYAPPTGY